MKKTLLAGLVHLSHMTKILDKPYEALCIFAYWFFEVSAFILLPLIIYAIIFLSLDVPIFQLIKLPEWMFIAIILYGLTLKKIIAFIKDYEGFEVNSIGMLSWAILGISVSSVLLAFSIIAKYKEFELPTIFYIFQTFVFLVAIISSAAYELFIVFKKKEGKLYSRLIPNKGNEQK